MMTYVKNTIIPELEEKHDPPFKLCIHENDFEPGHGILDNMQVAIVNSNSAILVMSQGFVDSMWCQQEFQYCHIEHMKDPAFRAVCNYNAANRIPEEPDRVHETVLCAGNISEER